MTLPKFAVLRWDAELEFWGILSIDGLDTLEAARAELRRWVSAGKTALVLVALQPMESDEDHQDLKPHI